MIRGGAALAINHVLRQQTWAADRLKPYAGRNVEFRLAPFPDLRLAIRADGLVDGWREPRGSTPRRGSEHDASAEIRDEKAAQTRPADLVVTLKPAALPHLLRFGGGKVSEQDRRALLREIELAGPADLAHVVQELVRELRWDVEEDLSRVFGDALAHRMANTGRKLFVWQQEAVMRLARNVAEYWTEENPRIVGRIELGDLASSIARLNEDVGRIEQRLARLAGRR